MVGNSCNQFLGYIFHHLVQSHQDKNIPSSIFQYFERVTHLTITPTLSGFEITDDATVSFP